MSQPIPLGRREDLHLEFKSADALAKPETIGREVVAMLNADGGEIWIGIRDDQGNAVEVQSVPDPERARDSLLDSLVDRLDPSPSSQEVSIDLVPQGDASVLRIRVAQGKRKPYALIKSGGRHFPIRVGSRVRPMSREEIFNQEPDADLDVAIQRIREEREKYQPQRGTMWLRLEPVSDVEIDVQTLDAKLRNELLVDPTKTGNRDVGWHFAMSSEAPRLRNGRVEWRYFDHYQVEVRSGGGMIFSSALEALYWKGDDHEIWPLCLLEYPISAFRLARVIYHGKVTDESQIIADMAFFGIRGWKLRRGSILEGSLYLMHQAVEYPEADEDLTWAQPLVFQYREIRKTPDRCGFRLVRRVYEAFGLPEKAIPREYDRDTGRLILPD